VAHSAVAEGVPLDLELSKHTLDSCQNLPDDLAYTGHLKVIDVLRHDCSEASFGMPHAEFIANLTWHEFALVCDFAELDREGAGGIAQARAWLVTMQHFVLGGRGPRNQVSYGAAECCRLASRN